MLPEDYVVLDMDNVHDVFSIMLPEVLQDLELNASLIIIFFLVFYDLDSQQSFFLMIVNAQCSSK